MSENTPAKKKTQENNSKGKAHGRVEASKVHQRTFDTAINLQTAAAISTHEDETSYFLTPPASKLAGGESGSLSQRNAAAPLTANTPSSRPSFTGWNFSHVPAQAQSRSPLQAKLTVGPANDQYEQEADRMAEQVMNMPTPIHAPTVGGVQRQEEDDEVAQLKPRLQRQEEDDLAQMKPQLIQRDSAAGFETDDTFANNLNSQLRGGVPLPASLRADFEPKFGADFSGVRVHTNEQSHQLNQRIQAKAFTTGQDIFFRQGAYEPGSHSGQELIAHELTHVVQQRVKVTEGEKGYMQRVPVTEEWKDGMTAEGLTVIRETVGDAKDTQQLSDMKLRELRVYLSYDRHRVNKSLEAAYDQIEKEYGERMKARGEKLIEDALIKEGINKWQGNIDKIKAWFAGYKKGEETETFDQVFMQDRMTVRQINTDRGKPDVLDMDLYHVNDKEKKGPKKSEKYGRGVESMEKRMNAENFLDEPKSGPRRTNALGLHEQGATLIDHKRSIENQLKPYTEATQVFMPVPPEHHLRVLRGLEGLPDRSEEELDKMRAVMTRITKAQASDMATGHVYVSAPSTTGENVKVEYGLTGTIEPNAKYDQTLGTSVKARPVKEADIEERRTRALEYKEILTLNNHLHGKEVAMEHREHEGEMFPIYTKWLGAGKGFKIYNSKDPALIGKTISDTWKEGSLMIIG